MRNCLKKLMPVSSWGMLAIILLMNTVTYFGTRVLTAGLKHYSLATPLDAKIPLIPFFSLFYVLAYLQWIAGFVLIGREGGETAVRVFSAELIAKEITLVCFVLLPTSMGALRPPAESLTGGGVWRDLTALIYRMDAADNLFPSIHCLESWICFRGALRLKRTPRWYPWGMLVMSLLVFASTVLIRQHVLADIAGGAAAVEIGLRIADRLPLRNGERERANCAKNRKRTGKEPEKNRKRTGSAVLKASKEKKEAHEQ